MVTENELLAEVIRLCLDLDLLVFHDYDSRRNPPGFPDLVIVGRKVVFAELKSYSGELKPEQRTWKQRLENANADHRIWRPQDWTSGVIQSELEHIAFYA